MSISDKIQHNESILKYHQRMISKLENRISELRYEEEREKRYRKKLSLRK